MKKKKTTAKKQERMPPLNLSGVKFEDALKKMLSSKPVSKIPSNP
jgi:hypothetical protein